MMSFLVTATLQSQLKGDAAVLYKQAQAGKFYGQAANLNPTIQPATNGKTFSVIWKSTPKPEKWIVSIHGSHGFATDDLAIWHQNLGDRKVGIVAVQWWLGHGDNDYLTPKEVYQEISATLKSLNVKPQTCMFHGFSRGSANSFPIVAEDATSDRFFSLAVASSGRANVGYPPVRSIIQGGYGDHPLKGTKWVTSAGKNEPNPERDGIEGMRATANWLKEQGATVVMQIEDETAGHGALQTNPANAKKLLDLFLDSD
ncbi:MAG: hypothetical protein ABL949_05965 [Fimbriimonadaceae bacterium]